MTHVIKKTLAVLIVAAFAAPAVSFADMHRGVRHERHVPMRHHHMPQHHDRSHE